MPDTITVSGVIATEPKNIVTEDGLKITSFRLASQQRRFDRAQSKWVDAETNWYSVICFRQLAENAQASLSKGERVLVRGRLKLREWTNGDKHGIAVEIEAEGLGHDLAWGQTSYRKVARSTTANDAPADAAREESEEGVVPDGVDADSVEFDRVPVGAGATPF